MSFLQGRIASLISTSLESLEPVWLQGVTVTNHAGAFEHAKYLAAVHGFAFIYTVEVQSLNLPLKVTEFFVSSTHIDQPLNKTRLINEYVFFA